MLYAIGAAIAFACFGVGIYFCALAYEQFSDTNFFNLIGRYR